MGWLKQTDYSVILSLNKRNLDKGSMIKNGTMKAEEEVY